jgi:hypothetical protein
VFAGLSKMVIPVSEPSVLYCVAVFQYTLASCDVEQFDSTILSEAAYFMVILTTLERPNQLHILVMISSDDLYYRTRVCDAKGIDDFNQTLSRFVATFSVTVGSLLFSFN